MPSVKPRYDFEAALAAGTANRYLAGNTPSGVLPGEILWDLMEEYRWNPSALVLSQEGLAKFIELRSHAEAIIEKRQSER